MIVGACGSNRTTGFADAGRGADASIEASSGSSSGGDSSSSGLTATNPVGLQVMGYGSYTSYTYPGGLNLAYIAPPPNN